MNINEIWKEIEDGEMIYWVNKSYYLVAQKANKNCDYQKNHFTYKNGKVLVVRHEDGHQSLLSEGEMRKLY